MTTATSDTTLEADRYLKEVAPYLASLPAEERADLLDDLAQHLREIAAEPGPSLWEQLGTPAAYAAELLASAGVTPAVGAHLPLLARAGAALERAKATFVGQELSRLAPVLRPAWWVIRAYLAVSLLAAGERHGSSSGFPVPRLGGSAVLGVLGVLVAIPLSVRLAKRSLSPSGRLAVTAANVVLVVYALSLLGRSGTPEIRYVDDIGGSQPAMNRGCLSSGRDEPITNLYAYDAAGRLLDPVLLYDQDGRPVDNLCPDLDAQGRRLVTEYRQDANGAPVINAFPRRQTAVVPPNRFPNAPRLPGTATQPEATVPVRPPAVVVPRLPSSTTVTPTTVG